MRWQIAADDGLGLVVLGSHHGLKTLLPVATYT